MHENLVIVESPAKAKTIEKFLGKDFIVKSSYGHIRDLAKKDLGIDIKGDFKPTYEVPADKKKVVSELSKLAKSSKTVWLASDEDREGEAIAWHLAQVLDLPTDTTKRIVFHEITKGAIESAVANPRTINMDLVNAQQARRILDRLVGFELSPVLWRKVKPSLSAGRVQSVTVRLLVEREREIMAFGSKPYYRVAGYFYVNGDPAKTAFRAALNKHFDTKAQAETFLKKCIGAEFSVTAAEKKPATKSPAAPFTTSTLQQEASRKFSMPVNMTMSTAQKLYENGHITYMRTDSVNLSKDAIGAAKGEIEKLFGAKYSKPRNFTTKAKGAQEAHEAIRPTYLSKQEVDGTPAEKKLYELIWKRTLASQMAAAELEKTTVNIKVNSADEYFVATGEVILFDGFLKLYMESTDDDEQGSESGLLPAMRVGDHLGADEITATQKFTQSPSRYSEASLVKRLEELGIGRPSTYAPTITTVINRGYVVKQNRDGVKRDYLELKLTGGKITEKKLSENVGKERQRLSPTDIGMLVNDYLMEQFGTILDFNFTANVEKEFDDIADGNLGWENMIAKFYKDFHVKVEQALEGAHQETASARVLGIDPKTGREVSARIGRYGPMVQIAPPNEEEKPKYSAMKKGQLIASITLEEALELFALPRVVGESDGKEVVIGVGRFGPYVRLDGKFTSLAKTDDPYTITFERAMELVEQKKAKDILTKTPIKTFDAEPELQVLNGRYGPYIAYKGKNYKIPKGTEPSELTLEECMKLTQK